MHESKAVCFLHQETPVLKPVFLGVLVCAIQDLKLTVSVHLVDTLFRFTHKDISQGLQVLGDCLQKSQTISLTVLVKVRDTGLEPVTPTPS